MIQQYIDFIISQIIYDSEYVMFNSNNWWNFLIFPYCFWLILFIFKYGILTLPVWLPARLILTSIATNVKYIKNKVNK